MSILEKRLQKLPFLLFLSLVAGMQLVFWQNNADPFGPVEALWAKILIPLSVIPLLYLRADFGRLSASWTARFMLALLVWMLISGAYSSYQPHGLKTSLEYILYAVVFFVAATLNAEERGRLMFFFVGACFITAVYGIAQHYGIDPWRWNTNFKGRPLGTIGNPNFFAGHLIMAWCLALAWVLAGAGRFKKVAWLVFGALTLVQFFSMTVGAWLGMAAAVFALWLYLLLPVGRALLEKNKIKKRVVLGAGLGIFLLAAGLAFSPPAKAWWTKYDKGVSVTNRLMMWQVALKLWEKSPVLGSGWGTYRPEYPNLQADILQADKEKKWNYVVTWLPHQNHLYWLAETGLIGLFLFLIPVWLAFKAAWKRLARAEPLALGAALALVGMLGEGFLNTFSNIPPSAVAFWMLLGLLAFHPGQARRVKERGGALFALGAAALLCVFIGNAASAQILAGRALKEGGRYVKRGDQLGAENFYAYAAAKDIAEMSSQSVVGVHYHHAQTLRALGRSAEAIAAYRKDLKDNPYSPELNNMLGANLGQYAQQTAGLSAEQKGLLLAEARKRLETAVRVSPNYASAMVNLGIAHVQVGDYTGAAVWWQKTLKAEPSNQDAKNYLRAIAGKLK